jgi:hypothetical protein
MKKPCSEMFCLRNQDITDAKAFFYLFFMSNSGYLVYHWWLFATVPFLFNNHVPNRSSCFIHSSYFLL